VLPTDERENGAHNQGDNGGDRQTGANEARDHHKCRNKRASDPKPPTRERRNGTAQKEQCNDIPGKLASVCDFSHSTHNVLNEGV